MLLAAQESNGIFGSRIDGLVVIISFAYNLKNEAENINIDINVLCEQFISFIEYFYILNLFFIPSYLS